MTSILPSPHSTYLETLIRQLDGDNRFSAILGGGSLVHGGFDTHSDLDLVLIVQDEHYADILAVRAEIANTCGGLLSCFTGEHVGEPRLLICLYGPDLLHVDLKFVRLSDLTHLVERPAILWARDPVAVSRRLDTAKIVWPDLPPDWFEARAWIWLHYCATKLQRGELHEAIGMLAFFREQVLGPLYDRRLGHPQRGVRKIEFLDETASAALANTVASHRRSSVEVALREAISLYLDLRNDAPPSQPVPGMPDLLFAFIAA